MSVQFAGANHPLAGPSDRLSPGPGVKKRSFSAGASPAWIPLPRAGEEVPRRSRDGEGVVCRRFGQ